MMEKIHAPTSSAQAVFSHGLRVRGLKTSMRIITILVLGATLVVGLAAFQSGRVTPSVSVTLPLLPSETGTPPATLTPNPSSTRPPPTHPPVPTPHPCEGRTPAAPKLKAPADGAIVRADEITLRWSRTKCALRFQIHVVQATRQAKTVYFFKDWLGHRIKLSPLETEAYKWRASGCFRGVCGKWSDWSQFIVSP